MGSTMPLVPKMEMPPRMPSRGLKVFWARAAPSGTEITTSRPKTGSVSSRASCTARSIMERGPGLMAASPTGTFRPGLVTRPTPSPPSTWTPGAAETDAVATIRAPSVTSGSSPLNLRTAQRAAFPSRFASSMGKVRSMPLGVCICTAAGARPVSRSKAAPLAAAAAQVPVV